MEDDKLRDKVWTYINSSKSRYDAMKDVDNKQTKEIIQRNMNKCVSKLYVR